MTLSCLEGWAIGTAVQSLPISDAVSTDPSFSDIAVEMDQRKQTDFSDRMEADFMG